MHKLLCKNSTVLKEKTYKKIGLLPLTLFEKGITLIWLLRWDCDKSESILSVDPDLLCSPTAEAWSMRGYEVQKLMLQKPIIRMYSEKVKDSLKRINLPKKFKIQFSERIKCF